METIKHYYRVDPKEISFLKFILEGYDNIGNITTLDADTGIIVINVAPGSIEEFKMVLERLNPKIMIEPVQKPDKQTH